MRAVARLVALYFSATRLTLGLALLGLAIIAAGLSGYLHYPTWSMGTGMRTSPLWYQLLVLIAPWLGMILLFSASTLLPSIVERFAFGRSILLLPGGRMRVLLSVLASACGIALLAASAGVLSFFYYPNDLKPEHLFWRTFLATFSNVSLMYLAVWIVGKMRGIWLLIGSLFIVLGIVLPLGLIGRPSGLPALVWTGVASWIVFGVLLLGGGRLRRALAGVASDLKRRVSTLAPAPEYAAGSELALLLGTSRPGVIAVGQAVPVLAATWLIVEPSVWLLYLTVFCAISGAVTSTAAAHSRALWLRFDWTRAELFRRVEAAYWRYTAYPLGVLLVLFVGVGSYLEFPTPVLALGLPLLVLGSLASSYLGLLMTRGLRWRETALGVATMALTLYAAKAVGEADAEMTAALVLEAVLAALAVAYRAIAQARWANLDWMVCRRAAAPRRAG